MAHLLVWVSETSIELLSFLAQDESDKEEKKNNYVIQTIASCQSVSPQGVTALLFKNTNYFLYCVLYGFKEFL